MVQRFNHLSKWVITEILKRSHSKSEQKSVIEKCIDIAKVTIFMIFPKFTDTVSQRCEGLNNFNGVLSIVSGLSNYTVQRLKTVWASVGEKYIKDFKSLETLMNPARNFSNYQKELSSRKAPVLPYLGEKISHEMSS